MTYNQPSSSASCTSLPCEWNKPRCRKLSPKQIKEIRPVNHQYGKKPRLSAVPSSDEYNACLAKQNSFFSNLTKNLRNINPDCALLTVVENDNKENIEILDVDIVCDDNVGANEEISTSKQTEEVVISSSTPNSTGTIANTNMSTLKTNRPVSRPMENAA